MPIIYYTYYTPISNSISSVREQEHALGIELLKNGLKRFYGIQLTSTKMLSCIGTENHGKPYLIDYPEIHYNISHCNGIVACAFHDQPIGIDVELPAPYPKVLINKTLSIEEQRFLQTVGTTLPLEQEWFYRLWTLKEAYVKKTGTGVDVLMTDFSFSFTTKTNNNIMILCSDRNVSCYQTKLDHGQILSLCYAGNDDDILLFLNDQLKSTE